jgi:UDP-N-acetylglucosamine/UDP-N-acetyl-alpha-D-glucosaminouronate 4-epimerase
MSPSNNNRYTALRNELVAHPRTWLVTGVAGFIGSSLLETLLGLGQSVVGLDDFSTGYQANIDDVLSVVPGGAARFRMIRGDIRDLATCREACAGADYVLHQAALGSVPRSLDDPVTSNQVNVDGTLNMFVAAREAGIRRVVYASSCAVYGDSEELPLSEDCLSRPLSPYAATKASNEMYATAFARSFDAEIVGLRYFNIFGRRQDPNGAYAAVIPRWVASLLQGEECRIYGDGETSRDFCHVANVVQANLLAATTLEAQAINRVYNVACGETTSLNELFASIRDGLRAIVPSVGNAAPVHEGFRQGDIRRSSANISNTRRLLGFEPTVGLADGLAEALQWYARAAGVVDSKAVA